jgi:hypothetical protein
MNNIYYVYHHVRLDKNKIFYVGKGKKNRYLESTNRNKYWQNVVNKVGFYSQILFDNLDEELAFLVECELIDKYQKIGLNLVNLTRGGEGASGYKHTSQTKKLISEISKGRKHSQESKDRISQSKKGHSVNKGKSHPAWNKDTSKVDMLQIVKVQSSFFFIKRNLLSRIAMPSTAQ